MPERDSDSKPSKKSPFIMKINGKNVSVSIHPLRNARDLGADGREVMIDEEAGHVVVFEPGYQLPQNPTLGEIIDQDKLK